MTSVSVCVAGPGTMSIVLYSAGDTELPSLIVH